MCEFPLDRGATGDEETNEVTRDDDDGDGTRDGAIETNTKAMTAAKRTTTTKTYVAEASRQKRVGDEF